MKSLIASIVVLIAASLYSIPSQAMDIYIAGRAGLSMPQDSTVKTSALPGTRIEFGFNDKFTGAGAVGLREGNYRSEIEIGYQKNDLNSISASGMTINPATVGLSGNVSILTGLVNAYYDIDTGTRFRPYVSGGVGFARIDAKFNVTGVTGISTSDQDTVLAYQFGAGLGYDVSDNITIEAGYRYLTGQDAEFGTDKASFASHNFSAGIRIHF